MSRHSEISKELGWDHNVLHYPSLMRAEKAAEEAKGGNESAYRDLMAWMRFLTSPKDDGEKRIIDVIAAGFGEARGWFE
jgi:hypothetical protein